MFSNSPCSILGFVILMSIGIESLLLNMNADLTVITFLAVPTSLTSNTIRAGCLSTNYTMRKDVLNL